MIFRQTLDESHFKDHNMPLHDHDGFDVLEVNLFPYFHSKVKEGMRGITIGALSAQLIVLNGKRTTKEEILRTTFFINKTICQSPLEYKEVNKIFHSNWKRYLDGTLDISKYLIKRRSFWSPKCRLTGNEKRKISVNLYYEPIREKSREKISNAIEDLYIGGFKITQNKVAEFSGLNLRTVKKYWKEFKSEVKEMNDNQ